MVEIAKQKKKEISSPHLNNLKKELKKIESAENYLEKEKRKLINSKEKIRAKIRKEKEVLELEDRIKRVRKKKK